MRYELLSAIFGLTLVGACAKPTSEPSVSDPVVFSGTCGASAGAALGSGYFVMADDEANRLRVYQRDRPGPPVQVFDLAADLELDRRAPETDIEGAARIGNRIYWITSHSRNHAGKQHPNRCRLFATELTITNGVARLAFVGRPYRNLLNDLATSPMLRPFNLLAASTRPPKAPGALNIEGLSATPDGRLLIGFRNPVPGGRALLVSLDNPEEVLSGSPAKFGEAIQLDLGGLGIRDLACWEGRYVIIAGPYDGVGKSKLFTWSGKGTNPRHLKEIDLKGLNPEAVVIYPDKGLDEIQLLSDDSSRQIDKTPCGELRENERLFRSIWVKLGLKHHKTR